jgi:hypothetical protein
MIHIPNDNTKNKVKKSMTMRRISVPMLTLVVVLTALLFVASLPHVNAGLPRRGMMDGKSDDQEFGRPISTVASSTSTSQSLSSLNIKENLASLYPTLRRLQRYGTAHGSVGSSLQKKERYLGIGVGRLGDEEYQKVEPVGGYKGNSTATGKKAGGSLAKKKGNNNKGAFGKGLKTKKGGGSQKTTGKDSGGKSKKKTKSCKSTKPKSLKKKKGGSKKKGSKGDSCGEESDEISGGDVGGDSGGGSDGGSDGGGGGGGSDGSDSGVDNGSDSGVDNEPDTDTGNDNGVDDFEGDGSETPTVRGYNLVFAAVRVTQSDWRAVLRLVCVWWDRGSKSRVFSPK